MDILNTSIFGDSVVKSCICARWLKDSFIHEPYVPPIIWLCIPCVSVGTGEARGASTQQYVVLLWTHPQHQQPDVWQQADHSAGKRSGQAGQAGTLVWKSSQVQARSRDAALVGRPGDESLYIWSLWFYPGLYKARTRSIWIWCSGLFVCLFVFLCYFNGKIILSKIQRSHIRQGVSSNKKMTFAVLYVQILCLFIVLSMLRARRRKLLKLKAFTHR